MRVFPVKAFLLAGRRSGRTASTLSLRFTIGFLGIFLAFAGTLAQDGRWEEYRSECFGYRLMFPSDIFTLRNEGPGGPDAEFASEDSSAKLKVFAAPNDDNVTPAEYRASILKQGSPEARLTYGPQGATWFVLSGVRGGAIYYQKVMFSCDGQIINAFALTYPAEQKRAYDPLVTTIEKDFRPASGPDCENR